MSTATPDKLMTVEEFLALPDDPKVERDLIQGEVWEYEMTKRSRKHSATESMIARHLLNWLDTQPLPRGVVASGEAGSIICRNPDSSVGIDVAYFSPEVAASDDSNTTMFDGPPILAVEILSPTEKIDHLEAKIRGYLAADVKLVWIVDPSFKTVTVHSPGDHPHMFSGDETISGDPHLPGFTLPVSELFQL